LFARFPWWLSFLGGQSKSPPMTTGFDFLLRAVAAIATKQETHNEE
jgi:hypothetical protein